MSLVRRELQLKAKNKQIQLLNQEIKEQVLSRYLPPELINDIFDGKISMDTQPHTKRVTVLFSDLSGFTKMSEEQGAEVVSDFLNDYLTAMNETIFANSGTIDKFIGDAIMVIFGAPMEMSESEQANNAARCALAMQKAMVGVNQKWEARGALPEVAMRIGIHQGQAVVGNLVPINAWTTRSLVPVLIWLLVLKGFANLDRAIFPRSFENSWKVIYARSWSGNTVLRVFSRKLHCSD